MTTNQVKITDPHANKATDCGSNTDKITITCSSQQETLITCWTPKGKFPSKKLPPKNVSRIRDRSRVVYPDCPSRPVTHELTPHCSRICMSPNVVLESDENKVDTIPIKSRYHRMIDPFGCYDEPSFELQGNFELCIVCSKPTKRKNFIHLACMIANLRRCKICRQYSVNNWSTCALCQNNTNQWLIDDQLHFNHSVSILKKRLNKEKQTLPGGAKDQIPSSRSEGNKNDTNSTPKKKKWRPKKPSDTDPHSREEERRIDDTLRAQNLWAKMRVAEERDDITTLNKLYEEFSERRFSTYLNPDERDRFFEMEDKCLGYQMFATKTPPKNFENKPKKEKVKRNKRKTESLKYTQKTAKHIPTSKLSIVKDRNQATSRIQIDNGRPQSQSLEVEPVTMDTILESEDSVDSIVGPAPLFYNHLPRRGFIDGRPSESRSDSRGIPENGPSQVPDNGPDPSLTYHSIFNLQTLGKNHLFEHYNRRGGLEFTFYSFNIGDWIYSQTFDQYVFLGSKTVSLNSDLKHLTDKKFPSLATADTILQFQRRVVRHGLLHKVTGTKYGPIDPEIKHVSVEMLSALLHHNLTNPHQSIETVFNKMEAQANSLSYVPYSRLTMAEGETIVADTLTFAKHLHEKRTFEQQCFRFGQNAHGQGDDFSMGTTLTTQLYPYRQISISTVLNYSLCGLILLTFLRSFRHTHSSVTKTELTQNQTTSPRLGTWDLSANVSPPKFLIPIQDSSSDSKLGYMIRSVKISNPCPRILTFLLNIGLRTLRTIKQGSLSLLDATRNQSLTTVMNAIRALNASLKKSIMMSINNLGLFSTVLIITNATLGPLSMLLNARSFNSHNSSRKYPYVRDLFYSTSAILIIIIVSLLTFQPTSHTSIRDLWPRCLTI